MATMKKIEAVIRSSDLDPLKSALGDAVDGPVIAVETVCFGVSAPQEIRVYRGSAYVCDAFPCVRLHMVVRDERVEQVLRALHSAVQRSPARAMGILVSDVQQLEASVVSPRPPGGHFVPDEPELERERSRAFASPDWVAHPSATGV
jgi:nitrogen regulatory protein PII